MALNQSQLIALKGAIDADPLLSSQPNNSDGAFEIAKAMNLNASPNFTVWKTNVPTDQIGKALNGTEVSGLTTANNERMNVYALYNPGGANPSRADVRAFFDAVFSGAGGVNTRAALLALYKRLATRGEKLFATGTGSDASPAQLVFEGSITIDDVVQARAV